MSVIKLNNLADNAEVNVVASKIIAFDPLLYDGEVVGSTMLLDGGISLEVSQSTRSLRGYVKKALGSAVEEAA
ncbi:hypothetical protein [Rhizobium phage RHph_X2_28B]|uniref:hypothetical protein n=1 Tax=Rhizobium phage RHph_X2_28B TaxID=2836086 RepID=UPI002329758E|nr:hypothetical protein PP751_gp048 [Rhizobium phage RHph_X2_28B]QWY83500.1 hypothetical protein [Rhizobium phage RHph_X2_28B]QWY83736.1 hypothetical protein [Rhizobium phage RHph_X3_15]